MSPLSRRVMLGGRIALGGVLFWLVSTHTGGWDALLPMLTAPGLLLPAVAFAFLGAYLESLRLMPLLRSQRLAISQHEAFRLVTAAFAFNFCIPGGASGDLSKLYYLRASSPGRTWELATVVFVDRLVGLFSMLLTIAVLGILSWPSVRTSLLLATLFWTAVVLLAAILVFAALCLTTSPALHRAVVKGLALLPLRKYLQRIADCLFQFRHHRDALASAAFHSLLGNVAGVAMFTALGWMLLPSVPAPFAAFVSLMGMFANTITITPGGLGVGEAAFNALFADLGQRGGAAVMIAWRISMIPLCLVGIAFYVNGLRVNGATTNDAATDHPRDTRR